MVDHQTTDTAAVRVIGLDEVEALYRKEWKGGDIPDSFYDALAAVSTAVEQLKDQARQSYDYVAADAAVMAIKELAKSLSDGLGIGLTAVGDDVIVHVVLEDDSGFRAQINLTSVLPNIIDDDPEDLTAIAKNLRRLADLLEQPPHPQAARSASP